MHGLPFDFAAILPEWIKPPVRFFYHPLYRVWLLVWCGSYRILEWFSPEALQGIPVPPPLMRFKVSGTPSRKVFLDTGSRTLEDLVKVLSITSDPLADSHFGRVLDFGCGCGRTLRWMIPLFPAKSFFGTDVDQGMVAWCQENMGAGGRFAVNRPEPPTCYQDGQFDLIFAISVFTHLDEARQLQWLEEFQRLLHPSGTLLFTVHGETVWSRQPPTLRNEIRQKGTLTLVSRKLRGLLPDWYQTTFHTRTYAEETSGRFFGEVSYWPRAFGFQDAVLCRRPLGDGQPGRAFDPSRKGTLPV